ncbi:hypothetical protein BGX38DRAFT_1149194 [Terfezia claveryi]|nr:hypothetical protein BGX38DRAFT_1149194 [Terfezia claveryi]
MQRCCSTALPKSLFARAPPALATTPVPTRFVHDITITRTGKQIIRNPNGGRYVLPAPSKSAPINSAT